MWHESLVGHRVVEVLKIFDYVQVFVDSQGVLNVYGPYKISGRDSRDPETNGLLRSLIGRTVNEVQLLPSKLTLVFSEGESLSVDGDVDSEYEVHSYAHAPGKSSREGFRPSMELTDAFAASEAILNRLKTAAEGAVRALGFASMRYGGSGSSGNITDGVSYYQWRWVLSRDTIHGGETFRRTLTVSFTQKDLSTTEAPVNFSWMAEIFRNAQLSWDSWSGQVSKSFSAIEREGFEELLTDASAQAEAALQSKRELAGD
jgi:hypothetical protein